LSQRTCHQHAVRAFMEKQFSAKDWDFSLPNGWGSESYFAHTKDAAYFIKLGAPLPQYQAMAELKLSPPVAAASTLEDGTRLLVQPLITGRKPSRADFRRHLEQMAGMIHSMHFSEEIRRILPQAGSECYKARGLEALTCLRQRWDRYKTQVPAVKDWVDASLEQLAGEIEGLDGAGVVAAHHDICNANWLITDDGHIYLIDLDAMAMDDPACDLGPLLWWYYPPELRNKFLEIAGYQDEERLRKRMRLRTALHCLQILLPRPHSFDCFQAEHFEVLLTDFKAILAGEENPQGYE
jgi:thiamine kinase-like enzyme